MNLGLLLVIVFTICICLSYLYVVTFILDKSYVEPLEFKNYLDYTPEPPQYESKNPFNMNSTDQMLAMKWKGTISVAQISKAYEENIIRLIKTKPLNNIWFGYQGFAWIAAFECKSKIKTYNRTAKFISRKVLNKRIHQYETEVAVHNLLEKICDAFHLV
jgi:hypothetical protein